MGRAKVGNGQGGDDADISLLRAVLTYVLIGHTPPAAAQIDQQLAEEYFKEAHALCERDGGRLWGRVTLRTTGDRRPENAHARHEPTGAGRTLATGAGGISR